MRNKIRFNLFIAFSVLILIGVVGISAYTIGRSEHTFQDVGTGEVCKNYTLLDENGNIYLKDGNITNLISKDEWDADPDDFENGWIFYNSQFVFNCNYILTMQRYNFTTGAGYKEYALIYNKEKDEFKKIADKYYTSQNSQNVILRREQTLFILDRDLNETELLTESIGEVQYRYYNPAGSLLFKPIVTNNGVIYTTVIAEKHLEAGCEDGVIKEFSLAKITSDQEVKILKNFNSCENEGEQIYPIKAWYDEKEKAYILGDCSPYIIENVKQAFECNYSLIVEE